MSATRNFLDSVQGSVKGRIDPRELGRSIVTALGSGSIIGVLILVFQGMQTNVAAIFPDPSTASLAMMLLTLILDLLRRQNQGSDPPKAPDTTGDPVQRESLDEDPETADPAQLDSLATDPETGDPSPSDSLDMDPETGDPAELDSPPEGADSAVEPARPDSPPDAPGIRRSY